MADVVQRVFLSLEPHVDRQRRLLDRAGLRVDGMGTGVLRALAEEFGSAWSGVRGEPLRRSVDLIHRRIDAADPELGLHAQRSTVGQTNIDVRDKDRDATGDGASRRCVSQARVTRAG